MFKTWFCRHKTAEVIRWHRNCVPDKWWGRELYVDEHDVICFVRCCNCKYILRGKQIEPLYATKVVSDTYLDTSK